MLEEQILENLCSYDKRNPMYDFMFGSWDEEEKPIKNSDCTCDNCFYGRDKLANELLKYIDNDKNFYIMNTTKKLKR